MGLEEDFQAAAEAAKALPDSIDNNDKLELVSSGSCQSEAHRS